MDEPLALLLYKQMILPTFDYCDFVIESGPEGLVGDLQTVQNHCLRCCKGIMDPRDISRIELHTSCSCKWLHCRRKENLLGLMYKHSRVSDNLIAPMRVLRSNVMMKLKLQRPKGNQYKLSPLYRGSFVWDKLHADDQKIATYECFMNKIRA